MKIKQYILTISALILFGIMPNLNSYGQCSLNGTKTDPSNPLPSSPPPLRGFEKNNFNWLSSTGWDVLNSTYGTSAVNIHSPFYNTDIGVYSIIGHHELSDFYPADGWELVKRDFGYLTDGTACPNHYAGPYFILYNKYSGILRVFAAFGTASGTTSGDDGVDITLKFMDPDATYPGRSALVYSNALSLNTGYAQALDQHSTVIKATASTFYPSDNSVFTYADFPIAFDPCTCLFQSGFQVDFDIISNANVNLYGRLEGTSFSVSNISSYAGSVPNTDFLTSVYTDQQNTTNYTNATVLAGIQTHKNIVNLMTEFADAVTNQQLNASIGTALAIAGLVMNAGGTFVEGGFDPAFPDITGDVLNSWAKPFEAIGIFSTFFGSQLSTNSTDPAPSVVQAEMALAGTITDNTPVDDATFYFANPGSSESTTAPEDQVTDGTPLYPVYNEILGTFALLNTPVVNAYDLFLRTIATGTDGSHCLNNENFSYQFAGPINYTFNPVMNVDFSKTIVKGALIVEAKGPTLSETTPTHGLKGINLPYKDSVTGVTGVNKFIFHTDFLPLGCLDNYTFGFQYSQIKGTCEPDDYLTGNIYLQLMVIMQSTDLGKNGMPNKAVHIFTYPVKIQTGTEAYLDDPTFQLLNYPQSLGISTTNYTSNGTLYAIDDVQIYGNLTANSGIVENIRAGLDVEVNPGTTGSKIGTGITLGLGYKCGSDILAHPVSSSDLGTFCNSSSYLASTQSKTAIDKPTNKPNFNFDFGIYPNPTNSTSTLSYTLPEGSHVNISVSDLFGQNVMLINDQDKTAGYYTNNIDLSTLKPGVYLVTIKTDTQMATKNIVVMAKQ